MSFLVFGSNIYILFFLKPKDLKPIVDKPIFPQYPRNLEIRFKDNLSPK